jgi:hypothetical protein
MRPALLLLAATLAAAPVHALLIRADRDDAEYLELATRYPSAVALESVGGGGVLVAPRWVLTSAQRAQGLKEMKPPPRLKIGGDAFEIESVFVHPEWKRGAGDDIGLVLLRKAVTRVEPAPFYRGHDEAGKAVAIVGSGETGKIGAAAPSRDGKKRASINTVDRVQPRVLASRVKPADEASDLQGALTPGDTGGPAFVETAEGILVAGIGSAIDKDWELYTRVSAFVPWLEAVMLDVATREAAAAMDPDRR